MSGDIVERLVAGQLSARLAEVEAERTAERALADQLARALRVVRVTRHPTHVDNVWSVVSHAIAAWEEARRER